jgi:ferredoxin
LLGGLLVGLLGGLLVGGQGLDAAQRSVHLVAATVGFLALALLWLTVVWGLVLRNGWTLTRMKHATVYGIHQTVALLGLCLGGVHAFAQLAVPGGPVRLVDEFVPFLNRSDPLGVGVAVVGLELMVASALSILIQRRLGYGRWRALHALTNVAFMLIVAHVLLSGSDVGPMWVWGTVAAGWLVTAVLWVNSTDWGLVVRNRLTGVPNGPRAAQVTVHVDARRCARFGFCEHEAPELFQLRADGRLSYRAAVPDELTDAAIRAVEVCPVRAIILAGVPKTVVTPPRSEPPDDEEPPSRGASRRAARAPATVTRLRGRRRADR